FDRPPHIGRPASQFFRSSPALPPARHPAELSTILARSDAVSAAAKDCDGIVAETHRSEIAPPGMVHDRKSAEPQVNPPPMASKRKRLPRLIRRSATASASAS